ncbi:helix-turn-helix domain-containing protein [Kitasatospora sp. NPDC056181]|uniref:helix-turn-helix domain-containing protein n=1 Tax=Kitasatospora sp. NPDC056181 TaxID=3345737 RepID=UPI0035DFAD54
MTHDDVEPWATQITKAVIAEVQKLRKELGMTARDLADACEELGHPIPRNVIANWESGRRLTLTVPEVLVLAQALDTPPAALVFPLAGTSNVAYLPFESASRAEAFAWFTGDGSIALHEDLQLLRHHSSRERRIRATHRDAWQLQFLPGREAWPPGSDEKFAQLVEAVRSDLLPLRAEMREWEVALPPLPKHLAFLDEELGSISSTQEGPL